MTPSIFTDQLPVHLKQSPRFFYLTTDLNGHCLTSNDLFNNQFNVDVQQPFLKAFINSLSSACIDNYQAAIKECVQERSVVSIELLHHLQEKENCIIYWEVSFIQTEDRRDQQLQWTGIVLQDNKDNSSLSEDFTEKKKAAEQDRHSELFFRALIADSLDGILLVDEIGTISFSSESVVHILGYELEDLAGKN